MWLVLIKQYWNVSILKEKPENTPYSPILFCIASLLFLLLIVVQWMMTDISQKLTIGVACLIGVSLILSYVAYTWVLLKLNRLPSRFLQTCTCLLFVHTIVHLAAFPLLLIMPFILHGNASSTMSPVFGIFYLALTLLLAVWQFVLSAYIYKHALTVSWLAAILAGLGLLACNILTISFW